MLQKSEMLEKNRYQRLGIQIENRRWRPQGDTDTETLQRGSERERAKLAQETLTLERKSA